MNELAAAIVNGVLAGCVVLVLLGVVGIFLLDLQVIRQQKKFKTTAKKQLPKIGIIIYTNNNEATIEASLMALRSTRLRSLEVIIVDNASSDNTTNKIRQFIKRYPKFQVTTIFKRKHTPRHEAVLYAQKKMQSKYILVVTALHKISKDTVYELRKVMAVADDYPLSIASLPIVKRDYLNLAASCMQIMAYNFKKALVAFGRTFKTDENDGEVILNNGAKHPKSAITKESFLVPLYYQSEGLQYPPALVRMLVYLATSLLTSYLLFIAVSYHIAVPFLFAVALFYSVLVLGYVGVRLASLKDTFTLLATVPLMYPLLFIYNILQIIKVVFRIQKLNLP